MKVSDYICQFLAAHRVRHIFAISGAGNVHLLDSIARNPDLSYICPHHEQAGVMAAVAYTRLTPCIGTMLTTGGPGAINAFTGVLDAWADSIPVLIISGQEKSIYTKPENPLRMWGVQGFDVVRAVSGFTKYAVTICEPESVRYHLEKAIHECMSGRPGPVWVDIPMDIQAAKINPDELKGFVPEPVQPAPITAAVQKVIELYKHSKRPVILLGHGLRLAGALPLIPKLIQKFQGAILTSWAGADMLPNDHPHHFGHAGIYGQRCANFVLQNSDFFLSIGSRLAIPQVGYEMKEFARDAAKIMVDIDPTELGKHVANFDLCIEADAGEFVAALLAEAENINLPLSTEWLGQCADWRKRYPVVEKALHSNEPSYINSYQFIDRLSEQFRPNEVIVTDMGTALTCTHQAIKLAVGQRLVTSTGVGEMGFGLPGAIGACFARPGQRVVLIAGDGSFMMNLQELQTVVHHNLPLKIFLYTNDAYLTIKHTQTALFNGRLAGTDKKTGVSCPDFKKIAVAFGIRVVELDDSSKMEAAIKETLLGDDAVLCDIRMHPMQPLVPKVSFSLQPDGSLVSPPLEDLYPFLPREKLRQEMIIGTHPKSELI